MALEVLADPDKVRNIGIMIHIDAGETTVTERILFYTGISYKPDETHDSVSTTDWMEQEKEYGITITSAVVTPPWNGNQINVIDTPGHVDFTVEVERSLRVLDGAVAVFGGKEDVEPQSETVWRQADKYDVPCICFINKTDRMGADFYFSIGIIRDRLYTTPIVMQIPIGAENDFVGNIDLLTMEVLTYPAKDDKGNDIFGSIVERGPIPAEYQEKAEERREALVEAAAEGSDELTEACLENGELSFEQIKEGIRLLTISSCALLVYCGTALRNVGVQPVPDTVVDFLPSPLDIGDVRGFFPDPETEEKTETHKPDENEPLSVLVFKIAAHPFYGKLTSIRAYSGKTESSAQVLNSTKGKKERIGKILRTHSNRENLIDVMYAGHIYAVVGLKDTATGDTLPVMNKPIILESMVFLAPVIQVAVEPKSKVGQEKTGVATQKLAEEDPTFTVELDVETGQIIIGGMGELRLDIIVDRMRREFRVKTNVGNPMVAYRETIRKTVEKYEYTHKKQTGGSGQFARVITTLESLPTDFEEEYVLEDKVTGGRVPCEYIPSVDAGIKDVVQSGVLTGYSVADIKATLPDGVYHKADSPEMVFKVAGSMALKEAAKKANPVLLEPTVAVEVRTPEEYMGDVIDDLNSCRGQISPMDEQHGVCVVKVQVPLSRVFGYIGDLRSKTQGRAAYSMEFDSYVEVPRATADEIVGKSRSN